MTLTSEMLKNIDISKINLKANTGIFQLFYGEFIGLLLFLAGIVSKH